MTESSKHSGGSVSVQQALAIGRAMRARGSVADRTLETTMAVLSELAQGKRTTATIERIDAVVLLEAFGKLNEEVEIVAAELKSAKQRASNNEQYRASFKASRESAAQMRRHAEAMKAKLEEFLKLAEEDDE